MTSKLKGRKQSPEHIAKKIKSLKDSGKLKEYWGKEESRIKQSEMLSNNWKDPEYRKKQSEAHKGKRTPRSEEVKRKISKTLKKLYKDKTKTAGWKGGLTFQYNYKRLKKMEYEGRKIDAEGYFTNGEWVLLKKQYNFTCPCCGNKEPEIKLTADHIIPLSKGGSDWVENIQPLCQSCNSKKHTKIIDKFPIWIDNS